METLEAIRKRASVREFEAGAIPEEDIERILEAGAAAASGMNVQPREFIVIRDRKTLGELGRVQDVLARCSAAIGIVADPEVSRYWLEDASASAENMLLAIADMGYGSVWVEGTLLRKEDWAKDLLEIPDEKRLIIFLPIGKPKSPPKQAPKKSLAELVHWESYGNRKA